MRNTIMTFLVSMLLVPKKNRVTSPAGNCISLKIQALFLIVDNFFRSFVSIYKYKKRIRTLTTLLKQCATTPETPLSEKQEATSENNRQKTGKSNNLYETLNGFLVKRQLYLIPDLSRDDLTYLIHLNKNHFAQILQQNSGFKLAGHLNNLRIQHAILLLKENPAHTIQATATATGFNNTSTFYSLFPKKRR